MTSSADIAKQLTTYDANRKSSADLLNDAMSQYGIPELRTRVSGLRTTLTNTENALNAVDPSVTGRTSRSLVTEAQRQAIVNKERQPIAQQYGDESQALSNETANLNDQQQQANQLYQGEVNDYATGRQALQSQYDNAVASESAKKAQAEADRQYQLQVKQLQEQQKEAAQNYQLAQQKASSGSSSSNKVTVASLFDGYNPKTDKFYTENVVIPTLISELGYSKDKAAKVAYDYRKAKFGE